MAAAGAAAAHAAVALGVFATGTGWVERPGTVDEYERFDDEQLEIVDDVVVEGDHNLEEKAEQAEAVHGLEVGPMTEEFKEDKTSLEIGDKEFLPDVLEFPTFRTEEPALPSTKAEQAVDYDDNDDGSQKVEQAVT